MRSPATAILVFPPDVPMTPLSSWQKTRGFVATLGARYDRLTVTWSWVEPTKGTYPDPSVVDQRMQAMIDAGLTPWPSLTIGQGWFNGGGSGQPESPLSSPPSDLSPTFDPVNGYSATYANFVRRVMTRWKGKLRYVAVENEPTSASLYWTGTADQYVKVLQTAALVIHSVDPAVVVTDGGIPSDQWGYCIAKDWVESGYRSKTDALAMFVDYYKVRPANDPYKQVQTIAQLDALLAMDGSRQGYDKTITILLGGKGFVDAANFHCYEDWTAIPVIVDWLNRRAQLSGFSYRQVVCNEMGIRSSNPLYDAAGRTGADDVTKKLLALFSKGGSTGLWFSKDNPNDRAVGIVDPGFALRPSGQAFRTAGEILGDRFVYDSSVPGAVVRHLFRDATTGSRDLEALFTDGASTTQLLVAPAGRTRAIRVDAIGAETPIDLTEGGTIMIDVSSSPVWVLWI